MGPPIANTRGDRCPYIRGPRHPLLPPIIFIKWWLHESLKDYMHCQSDEFSTHFFPTFVNLSWLYDWGSNLKEKKSETVLPPCDDMTSRCGIEPVQSHFEWVLNHWHTSLRLNKWVSCTFMTWLLTYKANVRPSIIVGCVLQSCSNFFTIYEVTKRVKNAL